MAEESVFDGSDSEKRRLSEPNESFIVIALPTVQTSFYPYLDVILLVFMLDADFVKTSFYGDDKLI